jgi:hypothetical protein
MGMPTTNEQNDYMVLPFLQQRAANWVLPERKRIAVSCFQAVVFFSANISLAQNR